MKYIYRLTGAHYQQLKDHLHNGDGLEAAALGLCGFTQSNGRTIITLHQLELIAYEYCRRTPDQVSWDGRLARKLLEKAMRLGLVVVKFHSHPMGYDQFSETDDVADAELIESAYGWTAQPGHHSSLVMLPDGQLFGRWYDSTIQPHPFDRIAITGERLLYFDHSIPDNQITVEQVSNAQTFGKGTTQLLNSLRVGVVGCSGTGSPLVENLVRLGIGELVLVDPDSIEHKNLNRIIHATQADAELNHYKTEVLETAINKMGFGTRVTSFNENLYDSLIALHALSVCDVVFGCMDSVDGRHLLNKLATFYNLPYFDTGVQLIADGNGGIDSIHTTTNYCLPGQSLLQRQVYTEERLRAADLKRSNPKDYQEQLERGYIEGADVAEPGVLPVNMIAAAKTMLEFMDRLHNIRSDFDTSERATVNTVLLADMIRVKPHTIGNDSMFEKYIGLGDSKPFLQMPYFSISKIAIV